MRPNRENFSLRCECGRPKKYTSEACARCRYLDGSVATDFDVISILREVSDGLTSAAISAETGRYRESVQRTLQRLRRAGRVTAVEDLDDNGAGRPALVYRLIDKGAA